MAWDTERPDDDLRALLAEIERTLAASEAVRAHAERQIRRKPFYPDRREPKHWQHISDPETDSFTGDGTS